MNKAQSACAPGNCSLEEYAYAARGCAVGLEAVRVK